MLSRPLITRLTRRGKYVDGTKGVDSTSELWPAAQGRVHRVWKVEAHVWANRVEKDETVQISHGYSILVYSTFEAIRADLVDSPSCLNPLIVGQGYPCDGSLEPWITCTTYGLRDVEREERKEGSKKRLRKQLTINNWPCFVAPFSQNSRSGESLTKGS